MLNIEELKFIKNVLENSGSKDETALSCIDKISNILSDNEHLCLWKFCWDCGRQGKIEGIFIATKEEVEASIGHEVYFGEVLGKYSEACGIIEEGEITLESDNPLVVKCSQESGYNPLEYLK